MPNVEHRKEARVEGYTKYWNKDSAKDTEEDKSKRLAEYTEVVNGSSLSSSGLSKC
jgi:sterol 24-C-methyltransferase